MRHKNKIDSDSLFNPIRSGGGGGLLKPLSEFLPSRIQFWSHIIVRWGLFPKKFLIEGQDDHNFS